VITVGELWSKWAILGLVVATGLKGLLWLSGLPGQNFTLAGLRNDVAIIGLLVPLVVELQRRLLWRGRGAMMRHPTSSRRGCSLTVSPN